MNGRLSAPLAGALLALPLLAGCGVNAYTPRPSPRVQVMTEGGSMVLVKNGHSYPFNMFGGGLEDVVQGNPQAEAEARSFRNKSIAGFVLSTVGSAAAGVGAGVLVANEVKETPSNTVNAACITAVVSGVVLSIVGGVVGASAQPHLWNAINIYNDGLPAPYPAWPQQPAYPAYPGYPAPGYAPPGAAPPAYAPPAAAPPPPAVAPPPPPAAPAPTTPPARL